MEGKVSLSLSSLRFTSFTKWLPISHQILRFEFFSLSGLRRIRVTTASKRNGCNSQTRSRNKNLLWHSNRTRHSNHQFCFFFLATKRLGTRYVSRCPCTTKQCLSKANTLGSKLIQKRITKCCYLATPIDHTIQ